jgi:hypothetical protein
MVRYASAFKGSHEMIAAHVPDFADVAMVDWGRRLNLAIECSCKQLGELPTDMKDGECRISIEATHYAEEVFYLMALLGDVP